MFPPITIIRITVTKNNQLRTLAKTLLVLTNSWDTKWWIKFFQVQEFYDLLFLGLQCQSLRILTFCCILILSFLGGLMCTNTLVKFNDFITARTQLVYIYCLPQNWSETVLTLVSLMQHEGVHWMMAFTLQAYFLCLFSIKDRKARLYTSEV